MIRIVLLIVFATMLGACNPDDRQAIVRSIVRVPVAVPVGLMVCDPPEGTVGITTERQLAQRTVRNEARHWRCVRSIRALRSFNDGVARRSIRVRREKPKPQRSMAKSFSPTPRCSNTISQSDFTAHE